MRFSCDQCSAKYTIADEKVRGKVVAVKCNKCGARITVNGKSLVEPEEEPREEATRVASLNDIDALRASSGASAPPASSAAAPAPAASAAKLPASGAEVSDGWYAIIEGQQLGPLSAEETLGHVGAGRIDARTYVWRDGQGDWVRAADVAELSALLERAAAPPPKPVPAAQVEQRAAAAKKVEQPVEPFAQAADKAEQPFESLIGTAKKEDQPFDSPDEEPFSPRSEAFESQADASKPSARLDSLLFDEPTDTVPTLPEGPLDVASLVANDLEEQAAPSPAPDPFAVPADSSAPAPDPFAAVPDSPNISKPGEIGEQTRFFMQKAGVTRRNPPWKIAVAILLFLGVPLGALYALSQMRIVPLEITKIDETTGEEVKTSVFSSEGLSSLRSMLLGQKPKARTGKKPSGGGKPTAVAAADPKQNKDPAKPNSAGDDEPVVATIDGPGLTDAQKKMMAQVISETGSKLQGPKVDPTLIDKIQVDGGAGLDPKVIREVVGKNLKAFQMCTEIELRRNPTFNGGKVKLTITVGGSGIVTKAAVDKANIEKSDLGTCLKDRAKKIVFPKSEGDPFDVEIPLILAAGA